MKCQCTKDEEPHTEEEEAGYERRRTEYGRRSPMRKQTHHNTEEEEPGYEGI